MICGVIFDMDGTMLDTERLSTVCWQKAGEELGIPIPESMVDRCRGRNPQRIRELFQEQYGDGFDYDAARKIKHKYFREIIEKEGIARKKGLMELLEFLRGEGIPAAVATSTERARAREHLQIAKVYDFFAGFVYGDEVSASKPEPDIFLEAAKKLGQKPQECLVLEDSAAGLLAGKAAGSPVIYIPDAAPVPEDAKEGIAAQMEDLSQVIAWIQRQNQGSV